AYESMGVEEYANALTSAGPWTVKEVIPDVSILYARNDAYTYGNPFAANQGPVQFDELMLKYIDDEAVTYAALETGEIDWAPLPAQYLEQAKANPNIKIIEADGTDTYYLGMNNQYYPFN
ncbi:MAG: ABC transporter substrate-binding protein, partial [Anaerolineaceae bacterium]